MKLKVLPALAAIALVACEKKEPCADRAREATLELVRAVNNGRCRVVFDDAGAMFDCPGATLVGEMSGSQFALDFDSAAVTYSARRDRFEARCVAQAPLNIEEPARLSQLQEGFRKVFREMEVD